MNSNRSGDSWLSNFISKRLAPIIRTPTAIRLFECTRMLYPNSNHDWVDIVQLDLELPRLPSMFRGYRIVQISDLHIGTWMTIEKLEGTIEMVNRLSPDLIAITGDFVSHHPQKHLGGIKHALKRLKAKDTVLAVLGNHDHWTDAALIRSELVEAGIEVLCNQIYSINRKHNRIHIAGVDDYYVQKDQLDVVLAQLPADELSILLVHEPDFFEKSVETGAFDLQISGHSHGGQILLPYIGPLYLPKYGRNYPSGLYKVNGMYLYTNRGLGTAELQVRLNCPPEITLFCLQAPGQIG